MELELTTKEDRLFWETREGKWRLGVVGRTAQQAMQHSQVFANQIDEADYIDDAVTTLESLFRTAECYEEWVHDQQAQPGVDVAPRRQVWDWPPAHGQGGGQGGGNAGGGGGGGGANVPRGGQNAGANAAQAGANNGQPQGVPGL